MSIAGAPSLRRPPNDAAPAAPFRYVRLPDKLLRESLHTPRRVGLYGLVARTWLATGEPVPLSAADVALADPSLSRGGAQRTLAWLVEHQWLKVDRRDGGKSCFIPTWGVIRDTPRLWQRDDPRSGRPPHVRSITLDLRLFDVFIGRLIPYPGQRSARVTRYLSEPMLNLEEVGSYALRLGGYGGDVSPRLERLGLVVHGQAQQLGDDAALLAHLSHLAFSESSTTLTAAGVRRAGFRTAGSGQAEGAPLFFVPRDLIDIPSGDVIDDVIAGDEASAHAFVPSQRPVPPSQPPATSAPGIPWEPIETKEKDQPTGRQRRGGGSSSRAKTAESAPLPDTPSAQALHALGIAPENIRVLADLPLEVVEAAIDYAEHEPGINRKAGWVVWALKKFRAHGFRPKRTSRPETVNWRELAAESGGLFRMGSDTADLEAEAPQETDEPAAGQAEQEAPPPELPPQEGAIASLEPGDITEQLLHALRREALPWQWTCLQPHLATLRASYDGSIVRISVRDEVAHHAIGTTFYGLFERLFQRVDTEPYPSLLVTCERPAQQGAPPAEMPSPPAWIAPAVWEKLPAMLRAALRSAQLVDGAIQWSNAGAGKLMEQRYRALLADLVAQAVPCSGQAGAEA